MGTHIIRAQREHELERTPHVILAAFGPLTIKATAHSGFATQTKLWTTMYYLLLE